ncbi:MFS transporter [Lentzea sp. CA-135723]|uniref:MFS transporter n=1 Tax=Lentzea sp. CA-135723 TaxID=3239950 RepID=UPI003D8C4D76
MNSSGTRVPSPRLYLAGWTTTTLGTGIVFPLTAVYLRDQLGLPVGSVSLYFVLFAIAGLVANPFAGLLSVRFGPGPIAVAATAFQTIGPLLLAAHGPDALSLTASVFSGAGTGIFYAVLTPLLIQLFGEAKLGRMLAAQNAVSAASVGAGAVIGGLLVEALGEAGYRLSFLANGISFLAFGLVLAAVLRGVAAPSAEVSRSISPASVLAPFVDRRFLVILVLQGALVLFGFGQVESVMPIVLRDSAQLQVIGISVVLAVNSLSIIVLQAPVLRLVERIGHVRSLRAALGCWALSLVALWLSAAVSGPVVAVVAAAGWALLFALGECFIAPSMQPLVVATAPPGRLASYTASTSLVHSLGNLAAPALFLPVFTGLGFGAYLGFQLAGYLMAVLVLLISAGARASASVR